MTEAACYSEAEFRQLLTVREHRFDTLLTEILGGSLPSQFALPTRRRPDGGLEADGAAMTAFLQELANRIAGVAIEAAIRTVYR